MDIFREAHHKFMGEMVDRLSEILLQDGIITRQQLGGKMKLTIQKPHFHTLKLDEDIETFRVNRNAWSRFLKQIDKINEALSEAVPMTAYKMKERDTNPANVGRWTAGDGHDRRSTHQFLAVDLQPIEEPDTKDKILRDMIKDYDRSQAMPDPVNYVIRARKILEKS